MTSGSAPATKAAPVFGAKLRVEAGFPVADLQRESAIVSRLLAVAVAAVAGIFIPTEMVIHVRVEHPLGPTPYSDRPDAVSVEDDRRRPGAGRQRHDGCAGPWG